MWQWARSTSLRPYEIRLHFLNTLERWSKQENHLIPKSFHTMARRLFNMYSYVSFEIERVERCAENMAKTVLATDTDVNCNITMMWAQGTLSPLVWERQNPTNIPLETVHLVTCKLILKFPDSGTRYVVDNDLMYFLKLIFTGFAVGRAHTHRGRVGRVYFGTAIVLLRS